MARPVKKDTPDSHGFLGPLYTEPGDTLGPEPVNYPAVGRCEDPLGLIKVKSYRRK